MVCSAQLCWDWRWLEAAPTSKTLTISTKPADAILTVDHIEVGKGPRDTRFMTALARRTWLSQSAWGSKTRQSSSRKMPGVRPQAARDRTARAQA